MLSSGFRGNAPVHSRKGGLWILLNHFKGGLVLASAALLSAVVLTGLHDKAPAVARVLATLISFYFGSRS